MKKLMFFIGVCLLGVHAWATGYADIDKYAHDAPVLRTKTGLSSLVRYLVKPYHTEEEKARVILAWIVHNIDYDDYKAKAIDDKLDRKKRQNRELIVANNDILETRTGVCEDIARLYQKMGQIAGLEVEIVHGKAGHDMTLKEFESGNAAHTWNVVKINREWEYVDPTWAMDGENTNSFGDVSKAKEYKKTMKDRRKKNSDVKLPRDGRFIKNEWFLTDKEEMIKTHFPDNDKWQLQKKKLTKEDFLGLHGKELYQAQREYEKEKRKNIR